MKLARTISLDISDSRSFVAAAPPGELAVTGTFVFSNGTPLELTGKDKIAFRESWLGIGSFGNATFVQVTSISQKEFDDAQRMLAEYIFKKYEPPGMLDAVQAARIELEDMVRLCEHPGGTLLAIKREIAVDGIKEQIHVIKSENQGLHASIWAIEEGDD